jgi:LacI family transcriptional regulator
MVKKHVSLKDLAQELKVSVSTVSRALNNQPVISKDLINKVQELAQLRNYKPNPYALRLLNNVSKTIGVIIPDIATYFYSSIVSGIESFAKEKGYAVVISSSQESIDKEKDNIENFLNLRLDGIIICLSQETSTYQHFDTITEAKTPLVFFDRVCRTGEISSVVADNYEAARMVIHHLHETGSRNIAFINGPAYLNICKERFLGYLEGLKDCGLKIRKDFLVSCDMKPDSATRATQKLLSLPKIPDAVLSINDAVAFAAMKEIKKQGLKIPDDIAMVGFTDEFHASIVEPELTSVMHPTFEMGQEAARLLINQVESDGSRNPVQVIMKTKLVVRESSIKKQKEYVTK